MDRTILIVLVSLTLESLIDPSVAISANHEMCGCSLKHISSNGSVYIPIKPKSSNQAQLLKPWKGEGWNFTIKLNTRHKPGRTVCRDRTRGAGRCLYVCKSRVRGVNPQFDLQKDSLGENICSYMHQLSPGYLQVAGHFMCFNDSLPHIETDDKIAVDTAFNSLQNLSCTDDNVTLQPISRHSISECLCILNARKLDVFYKFLDVKDISNQLYPGHQLSSSNESLCTSAHEEECYDKCVSANLNRLNAFDVMTPLAGRTFKEIACEKLGREHQYSVWFGGKFKCQHNLITGPVTTRGAGPFSEDLFQETLNCVRTTTEATTTSTTTSTTKKPSGGSSFTPQTTKNSPVISSDGEGTTIPPTSHSSASRNNGFSYLTVTLITLSVHFL